VMHFRRDFGSELSRMKAVRSSMKAAFEHWKNS
jgi:hypothetical protein